VKIFCPFTPQAAAGLRCAVTQKPRYDQRLNAALATTQPKAVAVALVRAPNHRQPPEDLSRYVGGHSRNTLVRWRGREPRPRSLGDETLKDTLGPRRAIDYGLDDASFARLSWRALCCKRDQGTKPRKPHKAGPQAAG
jgi:hypothetical protein